MQYKATKNVYNVIKTHKNTKNITNTTKNKVLPLNILRQNSQRVQKDTSFIESELCKKFFHPELISIYNKDVEDANDDTIQYTIPTIKISKKHNEPEAQLLQYLQSKNYDEAMNVWKKYKNIIYDRGIIETFIGVQLTIGRIRNALYIPYECVKDIHLSIRMYLIILQRATELPIILINDLEYVLHILSTVLKQLHFNELKYLKGMDATDNTNSNNNNNTHEILHEIFSLGGILLLKGVDTYVIHKYTKESYHTNPSQKLLKYTREYCEKVMNIYSTIYGDFLPFKKYTLDEWQNIRKNITPFTITCPTIICDIYIRTCIDMNDTVSIVNFVIFLERILLYPIPYSIPRYQQSTITLLFTSIPLLVKYDTYNTVLYMLQSIYSTTTFDSNTIIPKPDIMISSKINKLLFYIMIPKYANLQQDNTIDIEHFTRFCKILKILKIECSAIMIYFLQRIFSSLKYIEGEQFLEEYLLDIKYITSSSSLSSTELWFFTKTGYFNSTQCQNDAIPIHELQYNYNYNLPLIDDIFNYNILNIKDNKYNITNIDSTILYKKLHKIIDIDTYKSLCQAVIDENIYEILRITTPYILKKNLLSIYIRDTFIHILYHISPSIRLLFPYILEITTRYSYKTTGQYSNDYIITYINNTNYIVKNNRYITKGEYIDIKNIYIYILTCIQNSNKSLFGIYTKSKKNNLSYLPFGKDIFSYLHILNDTIDTSIDTKISNLSDISLPSKIYRKISKPKILPCKDYDRVYKNLCNYLKQDTIHSNSGISTENNSSSNNNNNRDTYIVDTMNKSSGTKQFLPIVKPLLGLLSPYNPHYRSLPNIVYDDELNNFWRHPYRYLQ